MGHVVVAQDIIHFFTSNVLNSSYMLRYNNHGVYVLAIGSNKVIEMGIYQGRKCPQRQAKKG